MGVKARLPENSSDNSFFSPQLILQRLQRGSNIFQGSPTFSRGGGSSFSRGVLNANLYI